MKYLQRIILSLLALSTLSLFLIPFLKPPIPYYLLALAIAIGFLFLYCEVACGPLLYNEDDDHPRW